MEQNSLPLFFSLFVAIWLVVTTTLSVLSGWFRLSARFPNQTSEIEPLLRLSWRSGMIGAVHMNGILTFSAFASGLRISINRLFAPFCRDIFVPWENITVSRRNVAFFPFVKLWFGEPAVGALRVSIRDAARLADVAPVQWTQVEAQREEPGTARIYRFLWQWVLITVGAAAFYNVAPLLVAPNAPRLPVIQTILFPALFFGAALAFRTFVMKSDEPLPKTRSNASADQRPAVDHDEKQ